VAPPAHWRPGLVALDIDGTLCVEDDRTATTAHTRISPAVRAAVDAVVRSDTHLVLCTGRSLLGVRPFLAELGLARGTAICSNGAVWLDAATGDVRSKSVFDPVEPVTILRDLLPDAMFLLEELGVGNRTNVRHELGYHGQHRVVDFPELVATPTTRLSIGWPDHTAADLMAKLDGVVLPGVHCTYAEAAAGMAWMFASPAGVTKGSSLERLRIELGVPATDTLAVGDGTNDLEMLAWAAHGVAMGQAPEVVRQVADEVTAPVTEDGLAHVLGRWFRP
jgi:HAD superfamily hydrolase (TIGR01484 family)